ncbi:SCP2 sterol-binding domain-containing protein [Hymenobacter rubripertinctus]|uniref:SCP2 sterol-binding domain-containing protein n=1 Tax=Hymenobacter rubripertinctus TaxID=2029981 RepID=UPI0016039840|nr:SCP2 sterol-binding domain-containing protein [Hymenobacter rubripertinctus]
MATDISKPDTLLHSVDDVIASMPARFHPENCRDLVATYQWKLSQPDRTFHISIDKGTFRIHDGAHPDPSVSIESSEEVYLKLVNGQMKDVMAVVTGKLRVRGSISLAQKLNRIFI